MEHWCARPPLATAGDPALTEDEATSWTTPTPMSFRWLLRPIGRCRQRRRCRRLPCPPEVIAGGDYRQSTYCHLLLGLFHGDDVEFVTSAFAYSIVQAFAAFEELWPEICDDIRTGGLSRARVTSPDVRRAVLDATACPDPGLASRIEARCRELRAAESEGVIPVLWPSAKFDAAAALEKLRGKKLMFVGDSLIKGQWQSFVCMVEALIPQGKKSLSRGRSLSVFKAKAYNASVEFYWAPFLVESNSDVPILTDAGKRVLRLDSVAKHARHWLGADILVFGTYVWWKSGQNIKSLWGSFPNGEEGFEELDSAVAYRIGLKTWANWADTTLNPNKSRVFFTTMSPTHMRSADWRRKEGIQCYNESDPITDIGYWGGGSDKRFMQVVASIVGRMRTPVSLLNITQLSEYRKDGHASIYTEPQLGKVISGDDERKKADPRRRIDCIHWCLPGVPDTWNRILYAHL